MPHTYATLPVSKATYEEIRDKLRMAGYGHAFIPCVDPKSEGGNEYIAIDMHGIALVRENETLEQSAPKHR